MTCTDGLLYDTRCNVKAGDTLVVDYEAAANEWKSGEWTGFVLCQIKSHPEKRRDFGRLLQWDTQAIWVYDTCCLLRDATAGKLYQRAAMELPYDEWFVVTFQLIPNAAVVFYLNETRFTTKNPLNCTIPTKSNPGHVTLGDSEFEGHIARFALYHRILTEHEIQCITWEFLHPRIVEVHLKYGHHYDNIRLVYSDCTFKSYGGKADIRSSQPFVLEDVDDDYVTGFSIARDRNRYNYLVQLETKKGIKWMSDLEYPNEQPTIDWTHFRCQDMKELRDLTVEYLKDSALLTEWNVKEIVETDVCTDAAQIQYRKELRSFYLSGLKTIKDEAVAKASLWQKSHEPLVRDWDWDAKVKWQNYLKFVQAEPDRFLKEYLIEPGMLNVSTSAIVLAASYKEKITNSQTVDHDEKEIQHLWKDRRVVLKFLMNSAEVSKEVSGRLMQNSHNFIVPIVAIKIDTTEISITNEDFVGKDEAFEGKTTQIAFEPNLAHKISAVVRNHSPNDGMTDYQHTELYKFCLVLPRAERTLLEAIHHENIAGKNWYLIRQVMENICTALHQIHGTQKIHGDISPHHIVRIGETWKLLGVGSSCTVDEPFAGSFKPLAQCSGYGPPELAQALWIATRDQTGVNYKASLAYDLWSLGCVFYELIFGQPLFKVDVNQNITTSEFKKLCTWSKGDCNRKLEEIEHDAKNKEFINAKELLRRLLVPLPEERKEQFRAGTEMLGVLEAEFFVSHELTLQDLHETETRLTSAIHKLDARLESTFNLISLVLKEVNTKVPHLLIFLPDISQTNRRFFFEPHKWLNTTVRLYFVDPVSLKVAPSNNKMGFPLKFPKKWVTQALPWIKHALIAMKIAAIAGRLAGIPIPDVAAAAKKFIDSQLDHLSTLTTDFITEVTTGSLSLKIEDVRKALSEVEFVGKKCFKKMVKDAEPVSGNSFDENYATIYTTDTSTVLKEIAANAIKELIKLLPSDWKEKCGLKFVTSRQGSANWVLPEYENEYKEMGEAVLGTKSIEQALTTEGINAQYVEESKTLLYVEEAKRGCYEV